MPTFDGGTGPRIFDHPGGKVFGLLPRDSVASIPASFAVGVGGVVAKFCVLSGDDLRGAAGIFRPGNEVRLQEVALRRNHHPDLTADGLFNADPPPAAVFFYHSHPAESAAQELCGFPVFGSP